MSTVSTIASPPRLPKSPRRSTNVCQTSRRHSTAARRRSPRRCPIASWTLPRPSPRAAGRSLPQSTSALPRSPQSSTRVAQKSPRPSANAPPKSTRLWAAKRCGSLTRSTAASANLNSSWWDEPKPSPSRSRCVAALPRTCSTPGSRSFRNRSRSIPATPSRHSVSLPPGRSKRSARARRPARRRPKP